MSVPERLPLNKLFIKSVLHPFCGKLGSALKLYARKGERRRRKSIQSATRHLQYAEVALAKIKMINDEGNDRGVDGIGQISSIVECQYKCREELENAFAQLEEFLPQNVVFYR